MLTNEIVSKGENGNPWSNCDIARRCNVDERTVRNYRKNHTSENPKYKTEQRTFIHPKTGKPAVMNTAKIGKSKRRKQYGGIARDAFVPTRKSQPFENWPRLER